MSVNVGSAEGYLDLDISRFLAKLQTAQGAAQSMASKTAMTTNQKLVGIGKSFTSAGKKYTKAVTLPVIGLGAAAVGVTAKFDSAMSKVSSISGATGKDLTLLREKAKEMGAKTKFSATESAEAFQYMAMAGWKTNDMLDGIEGVMNLAAASGEDLASVSDIVTDALTAFGLSAKDSGHFADVLAAASSNANTNVALLGESFKYAAPIAGTLGYSVEDTSIALGLMANAGIKASQSGTTLRGALTRLAKPTGEVKTAMQKYNLSLTDAKGNMLPLRNVMGQLRERFSHLSKAEQAQAATTLFGKSAMSGMLAIVNASEKDWNKLTNAIDNADGTAKRMSEKNLDNLKGQLTILKSALEGLAIRIGEMVMPALRKFVSWLQSVVDKLNKTKDSTLKTVIVIATLAAAFGPLLLVIGKLISVYISAVKAIGMFGKGLVSLTRLMVAHPYIALAAGIALVTTGLVVYAKKSRDAMLERYRLTSEEQKAIKASAELRQKYEEFDKTRDSAIQATASEFDHVSELKDEYNSLVGANGKIKKGNEDRANFIKSELASALGLEGSQIDELIDKNGKLSSAIDKVIQKKKAEALLSAQEDAYKEALKERSNALKKYQKDLETVDKREKIYNETKGKANKVMNTYNNLMKSNPDAAQRYLRSNGEIIAKNNEAKKSYDQAVKGLRDSETAYVGYNSTIQNYEGLSAAILTGDSQKISQAVLKTQNDFVTATNGTEASLKRQVAVYTANYKALNNAVKQGMPGVTKTQVAEAKKMVDLSKKELDKFKTQSSKSGQDAINAFANSIGLGKANVKAKAGEVGSSAKKGTQSGLSGLKKVATTKFNEFISGVKSKKKPAHTEGHNVGSGSKSGVKSGSSGTKSIGSTAISNFITGMGSKKGSSDSKAHSIGSGAKSNLDKGKGDTQTSGENFGLGFLNGLGTYFGSILSKAFSMGSEAKKSLDKGAGNSSPSKKAKQSGEWFVQGFINGVGNKIGQSNNLSYNVGANAASGILQGTKDRLGINSPSQVMAYEVGKPIMEGVAEGIETNQETVKEATATSWTAIKRAFGQNISTLVSDSKTGFKSAWDTMVKAQEDSIKQASKNDKKYHLSLKKMRKAAAKHGKDVYKDYVKEHSKSLKKLHKGSEEYTKAVKANSKVRKRAHKEEQKAIKKSIAEQKKLNKEYNKQVNLVKSQLAKDINNVMSEYQKAIKEQQNSLFSSMNPFSAFESTTENTTESILANVKVQADAMEEWNALLEQINKKVSGQTWASQFMEDLRSAGYDSLADVKVISQMTNDQWNEFNKQQTRKYEAANQQARQWVDISSYQAEIQQLVTKANNDLNKLRDEYTKNMEKYGAKVKSDAVAVGKNLTEGIKAGIKIKEPALYKYVENLCNNIVKATKKKLKIKSPSKVFADEVGQFVPLGIAEGMEKATPQAEREMQNSLDSIKLEYNTFDSKIGLEAFIENFKDIFGSFGDWFNDFSIKFIDGLEKMTETLGMFTQVYSTVPVVEGGYISANGFRPQSQQGGFREAQISQNGNGNGDTFIFNSPQPINEVEAARQMKKAKQDMAEGF